MSALSIRLSPEIEKRLELEVGRLKVTKSKFVQDLLESALAPKDSLSLLEQARAQFGLDVSAQTAATTNKAARVKALAREAVQKKHAAEKHQDTSTGLTTSAPLVAEPKVKYGK